MDDHESIYVNVLGTNQSAAVKVKYIPLKPLPGWRATEKFPLPRELTDRDGE